MSLTIDEIKISRHFRARAKDSNHKLTMDVGKHHSGIWLTSNASAMEKLEQIGICTQGENVYFLYYPELSYYQEGVSKNLILPFAFGTRGLQIPHPDGTVSEFSLKDISNLVRKFCQTTTKKKENGEESET